jgi:hypothetical protein
MSRSTNLLFSQKHFYYQSRRSHQNTQFPTVSHPNITSNYNPINITAFVNKCFDYLLRCLLHGTAKRPNYTQPYRVNGAKGECTRLHPQSLLPNFDSPPTLGNLRFTHPITQNGQLTLTNNHARKHYLIFDYLLHSTTQPYGVNGARWGNAPVFFLGVYCQFSSLSSPTLGNLMFTLPITQKNWL